MTAVKDEPKASSGKHVIEAITIANLKGEHRPEIVVMQHKHKPLYLSTLRV